MRSDSEVFIAQLAPDEQQAVLKKAQLVEQIEQRLSDERRIHAVVSTGLHPQYQEGSGMDLGVLLISDYGIHWAGGSRYDWPWDKIQGIAMTEKGGGFIRHGFWAIEFRPADFMGVYCSLNKYGKGDLDQKIRQAITAAQPRL